MSFFVTILGFNFIIILWIFWRPVGKSSTEVKHKIFIHWGLILVTFHFSLILLLFSGWGFRCYEIRWCPCCTHWFSFCRKGELINNFSSACLSYLYFVSLGLPTWLTFCFFVITNLTNILFYCYYSSQPF